MRYLLVLLLGLSGMAPKAQFKNDNIAFRTVYIDDLCDSLRKNPDRLILDVRSPGEFRDTSSSASLNIGHLKGAVNIDVNEVKNRISEIKAYKDKPVFVICSHSQRSRVCSKLLADSGFTHVINVNGAMTEFNLIKSAAVPCVNDLYETSNKYKLLSPAETSTLLTSRKDVFILDVRSDSAFSSISRDEAVNAQGRLKGAVNIPLAALSSSLNRIPANKRVLVVADFGRDANLAAKLLTDNNYPDVSVLFNGMSEWISATAKELPQREILWEHHNSFRLLNAIEFDEMMTAHPDTYILDVRPEIEFNNKATDRTWRNRGHIQNAVNIPVAELAARLAELNNYRNRDIIIYAFNTDPETIQAARLLTGNGFTRVHVLTGGLWNIRARAANQKGLTRLMKWVVDVPEENR